MILQTTKKEKKNQEYSRHYRDKKRTSNLLSLNHTNYQKTNIIHSSQIAGPSTRDVPYIPQKNLQLQNNNRQEKNVIYTSQIADSSIRYVHTDLLNINDCPEVHVNRNSQITVPSTRDEQYIPKINFDNSNHSLEEKVTQNQSNSDLPQQIEESLPSSHNTPYSAYERNSTAHQQFQKDFIENDFGHACEICDRLWFKNDLKYFQNNNTTKNIEFIRPLLTHDFTMEIKICSTCHAAIKKQHIPPLSVYNGFKYTPVPESLKNFPLDLVTERLISPRIPFMQIRRLRHVHGQLGIYGQVINVPVEVNTMVNQLPRHIDDDHSITVHIKRKKIHKSSYVYGIVNKKKGKSVVKLFNRYPSLHFIWHFN